MFSLVHVSDLHATPVQVQRVSRFLNKRALGLLSWRVRRRRTHRPEVMEALVRDVAAQEAVQVVVTGDLTNVAAPDEFPAARAWLERLGGPERVSIVPGNHDAYVEVPREQSWDLWSEYLRSDDAGPRPTRFPTLRVRGPLALVGLSSAVPTPPFLASGRLGRRQLERLDALLERLDGSERFRVLLVHHPPTEGAVSRRRALSDAAALREVLARRGVDLVLHGHGHRTRFDTLPGPAQPVPVVSVPSASDVGSKPHKRARYHVYDVEAGPGVAVPRIRARVRGYDPASGAFRAEGERWL